MKYGIIGAGSTGKAAAAWLHQAGCPALVWDRSPRKRADLAQSGLLATGKVEGQLPVETADTLEELAARCDILLIQTLAEGHRPVAEGLAGHLRPGQILLVTNCCWGAAELAQVLGREAAEKGCRIAETSGQLILANSPGPGQVYLKTVKKQLLLACTDPAATGAVLEALCPEWPQYTAASSILETSLSGTNPVTHGPIALFNLARMDNGEDYRLFADGLSPLTARFVEQLDTERVTVARACGVPVRTALELLNDAWPTPQPTLYDAFHSNPSYMVTKGPATTHHRFITEDLPYGLAPLVLLGTAMALSGAAQAACLTLQNVLLWLLSLAVMYVLMYALSLLVREAAFWMTNTNALVSLEEQLVSCSFRLPLPAITGAWKYILLLALPYGLAANFPACALAGQTSPLWWLYAAGLTAAFLAFALLLWRAGLRRYESASS